MDDAQPSRAPICFGVFELDPDTGELRKQGLKVRLQEQPFQILQILLEHPGKVVTREELRQRIWPSDTFVDFNQGLYNSTKKLREALGDSADTPRYIETLSRRGYRFIGTVSGNGSARHIETEVPARAATEPYKPRHSLRMGIVIGAGAVALLVAVLVLMPSRWRSRLFGKAATPEIRSIAVLPLENLSGDPAQEYFSDGMTDTLITDLAQIGSLKVISRTSSMQYKGVAKKSLPEIASELNVDGIVEGTVQRSGDRVRINAQLIHGPSDKHLWANSYERELRDVFVLEQEVTQDIAHHIQERLTTTNFAPVALPKQVDAKVLEAYFLGNYYLDAWGKGGGDDERRKAAKYFQEAIDADPSFAPAYNGLAISHWELLWSSKEDAEIAIKAARQSALLDPNFSEAHRTLGDISWNSWDWSTAENEYRRAIAINPNNADAHDWLGHLLDSIGRLDEGWKEQQYAQELDPNHEQLTEALSRRGQHDRAISHLDVWFKRYPNDGFIQMSLCREYLSKQMYKEASIHLDQTNILFGLPQIAAESRRVAAGSGYKDAIRASARGWEHLISTHQAFLPVNIAELYSGLGDKDRAFYWLEQAYTHRDMVRFGLQWLNTEALFDPLRSDPRFKDLLRRVGLPDWVPTTGPQSFSDQH